MNKHHENLSFTATHEWLKKEDDGVIVGITDHAQELLGDMVFVELPQIGDRVSAGDEMGVVESVKAASDIYAPISGVVVAVNEQVNDDPALLNQDPYGAGWLVKLAASNLDEINGLLNSEEYEGSIAGDHH